MATKKITDLVEITTAASDDVLPIVDVSSDITNKITTTNLLKSKQDLLESGTNIKTINSNSLLGSGDVSVQETLVSGTNIKTINSTSLLGSGDISISANPSGGAGSIQFSDGSAFASDSNLFWDNTNKYLGVGETTPTARVQIKGVGASSSTTSLLVQNSSGTDLLKVRDDGVVQLGTDTDVRVTSGQQVVVRYNMAVGTLSAPTARLQIKGSGSTSATTSLLVENSSGTQSLKLTDSGSLQIGLTSGINWTFNTNILSNSQKAFIAGSLGSVLTNGNFSGGVFGNDNGGKVADSGIGTPQVASAVLEVSSTTRGFLPPRMTTTQKNAISSPASGLMVYDTDTNKLCCYNGTSWNDLF